MPTTFMKTKFEMLKENTAIRYASGKLILAAGTRVHITKASAICIT